MKKALSVFLLAVLLLGLLPALAPPARAISFALVSANRTSAYVGDPVTWSVYNEIGSFLYYYSFTAYKDGIAYAASGFQGLRSFTIHPTSSGTYRTNIQINDPAMPPNLLNISGGDVTVTLRPAPKISKVEALSGTSLKLAWNRISGATGYEVSRSTAKEGAYTLVKRTTAAALTDTGLKAGQRYYYKVRTYNYVAGFPPIPSGVFSSPAAGVPLGKPAITGAVGASASSVKLAWGKVTGATGYQILMGATASGVYKAVKSTTALSTTVGGLQPAKTYYFKVRAYKLIGTARYYGPLSAYRAGRTK